MIDSNYHLPRCKRGALPVELITLKIKLLFVENFSRNSFTPGKGNKDNIKEK